MFNFMDFGNYDRKDYYGDDDIISDKQPNVALYVYVFAMLDREQAENVNSGRNCLMGLDMDNRIVHGIICSTDPRRGLSQIGDKLVNHEATREYYGFFNLFFGSATIFADFGDGVNQLTRVRVSQMNQLIMNVGGQDKKVENWLVVRKETSELRSILISGENSDFNEFDVKLRNTGEYGIIKKEPAIVRFDSKLTLDDECEFGSDGNFKLIGYMPSAE